MNERIIPDDIFRRVEGELFRYQQFVREYHEKREELLYSTPRPDSEGRSIGHISDPTLARGIKLAELDESDAVKWAKVINYALSQMPEQHRLLVRYRYFEGVKKGRDLAKILHIDEASISRMRVQVVYSVATWARTFRMLDPIPDLKKLTIF